MNELNKLIEKIKEDCFHDANDDDFIKVLLTRKEADMLVDYLKRPTCGVEQRKFLDEVEKFQLSPSSVIRKENVHLRDYVDLCNYTRIDFQKVIKGE